MAVITPDLGYGATVAFATTTFSAALRSVTIGDKTREVIDVSHLATVTNKLKLVGDLVDVGSFDAEFIWDSGKIPPISAVAEVITVTLPDSSTIIGQGAVTSYGGPNLAIEDLQVGTLTVTWNGLNSAGNGAGPVVAVV